MEGMGLKRIEVLSVFLILETSVAIELGGVGQVL